MELTKRDLQEQAAQLNKREEYLARKQRCDDFIESLEEHVELNTRDHQSV